jgi:hypothetical protein
LTIISLVLDAGVAAPGSAAYPYFAAAQNGLVSALCTCLLINGFVGFQLYEDGTTLSVWLLRLSSLAMFIVGGAVNLLTFKGWAGLEPGNPVGIFVVTYIVNAICLFIYTVSQIILVVGTLEDRWPLGDISFGIFFFVIGQVILYVFSDTICDQVQHYIDGLFFATICNLLAVMMVYKVRFSPTPCIRITLTTSSTGIPSLAKISNSPSASSNTTGRSRSLSPRRTSVAPCTRTRTTHRRYTSSRTRATRTTQPSATKLTTTSRICLTFDDTRFAHTILRHWVEFWRISASAKCFSTVLLLVKGGFCCTSGEIRTAKAPGNVLSCRLMQTRS